jgi:hypothetical protein
MENTKHYKIEVTQGYGDFVEVYEMDLDTDRLDWSLEQYGRNRGSIKFKVLEIDGVVQTDNSSSI